MASNRKQAPWQKKLRALLQKPAALPILAAVCGLIIVAIAAIVVWFTVLGGKPAESGSTSWSEPASDASYDATADKVDVDAYKGTVLPETEDAGQEYLGETLFLGDSNTVRYMVYGPEGSDEPFTTIDNNIGVVSMGVQQISSLKCENFVGRSSAVTMPEAVKIMQPRRVIIGFGTNNLTMDVDTFIEEYKEGLAAIHEAYPYADIIVNAIPPLDKQRSNTALSMKQVDALNSAIVKMCEEEGYKYLDSSQALEDPETGWARTDYTLSDGVHLSQNGVRALFDYIKTHAYITEDTRPKPLNKVPQVQGVTPNLITSDPIAVRGENGQATTKVPVEFVCSEGGHLSGATSQMVAKGGTCSTVTAVPDEGWVFAGWAATIGSTGGSGESLTFTVPANADANGVILTAYFEQVEAEPTATPEPTASPSPKPTQAPTAAPTTAPSAVPTAVPTAMPTAVPTAVPTAAPTAVPTAAPTPAPTPEPVPTEPPATEAPASEPAVTDNTNSANPAPAPEGAESVPAATAG